MFKSKTQPGYQAIPSCPRNLPINAVQVPLRSFLCSRDNALSQSLNQYPSCPDQMSHSSIPAYSEFRSLRAQYRSPSARSGSGIPDNYATPHVQRHHSQCRSAARRRYIRISSSDSYRSCSSSPHLQCSPPSAPQETTPDSHNRISIASLASRKPPPSFGAGTDGDTIVRDE